MDSVTITLETGRRRGVFDITAQAARFVATRGDGLLSVFAAHSTAGLAIIETGSGSDRDLMDAIDRTLPRDDALYRHRHGSPGHGADHVLPGFVAPSVTVPVQAGRMQLGTWQALVLVDGNEDNTSRRIHLSFLSG
jgi:secondary thiamine-phosphate synthase enzyme